MGLAADAESILQRYADAYPHDAEAQNALGVVALGLKKPDQATHLDRAIALMPRGHLLLQPGRGAGADLRRRWKCAGPSLLCRNWPKLYVDRGDLRLLLREAEAGCKDLKKACDLGWCRRQKNFRRPGAAVRNSGNSPFRTGSRLAGHAPARPLAPDLVDAFALSAAAASSARPPDLGGFRSGRRGLILQLRPHAAALAAGRRGSYRRLTWRALLQGKPRPLAVQTLTRRSDYGVILISCLFAGRTDATQPLMAALTFFPSLLLGML